MVWPLLAAGVAAASSAWGASKQNKENKEAAATQMRFQEKMSNTSYQRAVKDMREAGINPILAAKVGGASTPGGASYVAQNVGASAAEGASKVSHSAVAQKTAEASVENLQAQNALLKFQAHSAAREAELADFDLAMFKGPGGKALRAMERTGSPLGAAIPTAQEAAQGLQNVNSAAAAGRVKSGVTSSLSKLRKHIESTNRNYRRSYRGGKKKYYERLLP